MIDVKKVAHLARLDLSKDELETFEVQLNKVLSYIEELSEVNTDGVEPMVTPTAMSQFLRVDEAQNWQSAEVATSQAAEKSGHLFKVPPVV